VATQTLAPALIDPNGKTWHPTGKLRGGDGDALYVIEGVDGAKVAACFQSTRGELENIFGQPMTALGGPA
jgi:hypothetical protein